MRELLESIALEGTTLTVTASRTLPEPGAVLAAAAAIRIFERYPVIDRVTLLVDASELVVSRRQVESLLGIDGFAALADRERWQQTLDRLVQDVARD